MEFEKLKKIIVDVLNVDENEITMDTTFIDDLGADSLDVFQIIMGDSKRAGRKDCYGRRCGRTDQSCNERKLNTDTKGVRWRTPLFQKGERSDRY